jgi:hypothetical protein
MKLCECGCGLPAPIARRTNKRDGTVKGLPQRFVYGHNAGIAGRQCATHGMYGTAEYWAYHAARKRCTNPASKDWPQYGGRGIKFLFTGFEQFFSEIGRKPAPKLTLDRKDNDGHYAPGNVRWATQSEQIRNKRFGIHKRTAAGTFACAT